MSIAHPCPYSKDKEFCKHERFSGHPNLSMCKNCDWFCKEQRMSDTFIPFGVEEKKTAKDVPVPEPPKMEFVKEDFLGLPVKNHTSRGGHRLSYRWESYKAEFNRGNDFDYIDVWYKEQIIAKLERDNNKIFSKYKFTKADMEDLNGIYDFLKDKGIRFKRI